LTDRSIGDIRKIVFYTGHRGPREIGCSEEFLAWLTDPVQNGAGALNDFGCYGADLATWLLKGEKPLSVSAVTQQIKPDVYPKVDDEATIVIRYAKAQVVIQASWNWPYNRKEMELYGSKGYVFCKDGTTMMFRENERSPVQSITAPALPETRNDPFVYFANVIRGNIKPSPWDLSSSETNEMVVKILDAAKRSAKTGQAVTVE
jgi:predicted dehydrogenase